MLNVYGLLFVPSEHHLYFREQVVARRVCSVFTARKSCGLTAEDGTFGENSSRGKNEQGEIRTFRRN